MIAGRYDGLVCGDEKKKNVLKLHYKRQIRTKSHLHQVFFFFQIASTCCGSGVSR